MQLLSKKQIRIAGKDYPIKLSVRAMIEFEDMAKKPLSEMISLKDITMIFYCVVKAGGSVMTYDQFMDLIDDNPDSLKEFNNTVFSKVEKKMTSQ